MGVELTKSAIDLGVVVRDGEAALAFYRDTLGLEHVADMPVPGGGTMHRLAIGDTVLKLLRPGRLPDATNPPGGIGGGSGLRYFTLSVSNLADILRSCEEAGYTVVWKEREIRPGVRVGMVEDPDGNWVEFLQQS